MVAFKGSLWLPGENSLQKTSFLCMCIWSVAQSCLTEAPWTVAHQAPVSMKFSKQLDGSGLPFPILGDLPNLGTEPASPAAPASAGGFFTTSATWETHTFRLSANSTANRPFKAARFCHHLTNSR